jgi:hypothetical protein
MGRSRPGESLRRFVFARHAESSANVEHVMSSDPGGGGVANLDIDLAVCSRFLRTQQTLEIALRGRPVPVGVGVPAGDRPIIRCSASPAGPTAGRAASKAGRRLQHAALDGGLYDVADGLVVRAQRRPGDP